MLELSAVKDSLSAALGLAKSQTLAAESSRADAYELNTKLTLELSVLQASTSSTVEVEQFSEAARRELVASVKKEAYATFRSAYDKEKADTAVCSPLTHYCATLTKRQNLIKRGANRLAESEKKLARALTELAVAKYDQPPHFHSLALLIRSRNRPLIDARIADSSPIDESFTSANVPPIKQPAVLVSILKNSDAQPVRPLVHCACSADTFV